MKTKKLAVLTCCMLLLVGTVGATLAWLTDTTDVVQNKFTPTTVDVELTETTGENYEMVPGNVIDKDPFVTVKAGSEDSWVFITVDENGGDITIGNDKYSFADFITYKIDPNNWTKLEGVEGVNNVYYCSAKDIDADRNIKVLGYEDANGEFHPNEVMVNDTVTKEMMDALTAENYPILTFQAYMVQMANLDTPQDAWKALNE